MLESTVVKPANDLMKYRMLHLENGMRVMLVSDPDADKAACSMDVNIGSLADPTEFPGLAHFCEHMLFYASKKYPQEDEYSKFISDHGGSTNAWTASENTNYQFSINWDHLEPALDRFAQFFLCPLISADGVEREVNAVDSEHSKNLASDPWRLLQLAKHTANQDHPWSHFSTGSRATLIEEPRKKGLDPRQAVVDFHAKYYSSNICGLAVLGRHSLDELEAMVRPRFSEVLDKKLEAFAVAEDVFLESHLRRVVKALPVKEGHSLELSWQVPPSWKEYKSSPLNFLSHLLGHEGDGSLFSLLKQIGWATALSAGESGLSISSRSFFYVKVELTDEGQEHVQDVGAMVFRYLRLISGNESHWETIYEEVRGLSQLRFDFRDKPNPYSYVTSLSGNLLVYPEHDLLLAAYHVPQEYCPDLIRTALLHMTLDKVRICWTSHTFGDVAVLDEPWYGTKYCIETLPDAWAESWGEKAGPDARLHLPRPNPFIPTDFTLHKEDAWEGSPKVVLLEPCFMRVHHKCDMTFNTPKAVINLDFQSPEAYNSPEHAHMTKLFVALVEDELSELSYDAELAGLQYAVSNTQSGFGLSVSGYSHKLLVLLEEVLGRIFGFVVREDRLTLVAERIVKDYRNMKFQQPYQWAMYRRELMLNLKRWKVEEYLEVAGHVDAVKLKEFHSRLLGRVYIDALATGNIKEEEVLGMATRLKEGLVSKNGTKPVFPSQMRDFRTIRLPHGTSLVVERGPNPSNDNSAVTVVYQAGPDHLRGNALLQLLVYLSKRDAFHVLRTQQQLGYIVSMFEGQELRVHHLEVVVQSNAFSAADCAHRIEAFVKDLLATGLGDKCSITASKEAAITATDAAPQDSVVAAPNIGDVAEDDQPLVQESEFSSAVKELSKAKLEKPKKLSSLANQYWSEIYYGTLVFDRQELEVRELGSISPQELIDFATRLLGPEERRKGVVAVIGSAEEKRRKDDIRQGPSNTVSAGSIVSTSHGSSMPPAIDHMATETGNIVVQPACGGDDGDPSVIDIMVMASAFGGLSGEDTRPMTVVTDFAEFKRQQEVFPNVAALHDSSRRAL
ncbi:hypothetical protein CEUSTIGMA_g5262.t1 [Chlamydomonas eustigma]|uniref:Peptidase M16 N-terminal domain-containing protein n=1 Tax=Chlamydomonas eustigma TaxID=1157962 RepID=A0A250X4H7_9CHLO|nr:hypothetical protein CEUSTIGMA_g5262.t1 [Chlamydomonas eustigma]|eukprot:GAX77819.1 hypothetical protein CEUSTIGMA_g5262.t1 [Chlamydomonas eustigma]